MKSKELIRLLKKFDENAEITLFFLETGKSVKLRHEDIEVLDTNRIEINIHA
jgi:hypothetical protein